MIESIFDIENVSDLPVSIRQEIRPKKSRRTFFKEIVLLFEERKELSISEIIAAIYRKHGIALTRRSVSLCLHNNAHRRYKCLRVYKGKYSLKEKINV